MMPNNRLQVQCITRSIVLWVKISPKDLEEQSIEKIIELGIKRAGSHSKFWHGWYLKLFTVLIIVNKIFESQDN